MRNIETRGSITIHDTLTLELFQEVGFRRYPVQDLDPGVFIT